MTSFSDSEVGLAAIHSIGIRDPAGRRTAAHDPKTPPPGAAVRQRRLVSADWIFEG